MSCTTDFQQYLLVEVLSPRGLQDGKKSSEAFSFSLSISGPRTKIRGYVEFMEYRCSVLEKDDGGGPVKSTVF